MMTEIWSKHIHEYKMLSFFGVTVVLHFVKILSGSRNLTEVRGQVVRGRGKIVLYCDVSKLSLVSLTSKH